jgi:dihydrofolate reductase
VAEVVYYVASSLDGFIATPEGGVEWLAPFEVAGEDYGYGSFYESVDAVLLGARTYEQALGFPEWPYSAKPTWVFAHGVHGVTRGGVTVTKATPAEVVSALDTQGIGRAWLVGGGRLAGSFRAAGLITEYIVSVIPVLLGAGVPLLGAEGSHEDLRLVGTTRYGNGIVQLRYMPAR